MHGYELLVPFMIADRERQAKEARLAHLAADDVPFQHQTPDVEVGAADIPAAETEARWLPALRDWPYDSSRVKREDAEAGRTISASTIPALGRLINRFTGRPNKTVA
jgi:hypothetical protein